jgi:hypothetical protein
VLGLLVPALAPRVLPMPPMPPMSLAAPPPPSSPAEGKAVVRAQLVANRTQTKMNRGCIACLAALQSKPHAARKLAAIAVMRESRDAKLCRTPFE